MRTGDERTRIRRKGYEAKPLAIATRLATNVTLVVALGAVGESRDVALCHADGWVGTQPAAVLARRISLVRLVQAVLEWGVQEEIGPKGERRTSEAHARQRRWTYALAWRDSAEGILRPLTRGGEARTGSMAGDLVGVVAGSAAARVPRAVTLAGTEAVRARAPARASVAVAYHLHERERKEEEKKEKEV